MKKDYQKPEAEYISLVAQEIVASEDDYIDGDASSESNNLGL